MPRVSVIITTYNRANLVGRAIESVIDQTYGNIEIVVVDDGSTDNTREVLDAYAGRDSRIRIIYCPSNRGVSAAKNRGLDAASGALSTMLDSDDEFLPHAISTFVELFEQLDGDYGMVCCNCIDPATDELTGYGMSGDGDITYEDVVCSRVWGEYSGMWRTELVSDLRFREDEAANEGTVWSQIYRRCKVRYRHVVVRRYYRGSPDSVSTMKLDRDSNRQAAASVMSYLAVVAADVERLCPDRLASIYRTLALYAALAGQRNLALGSALRAIRFRRHPGTLAALPLACMPRFAVVSLLRRYTERQDAKRASG